MKRSTTAWLIGTAAIMFGMPGAARYTNMDAFMVLIVLEFFIIGPLSGGGHGHGPGGLGGQGPMVADDS